MTSKCMEAFNNVSKQLFKDEVLISDSNILIGQATSKDHDSLVALYKGSQERGDWFGGRLEGNGREAISSLINKLLNKENIIFIKFSDSQGEILGATLLEYENIRGVLIDETQIHPVLGRRKGIMTAYFKKVVPILECNCTYWTEFVMTEGSRILRKVLIDDFKMVPVAYMPAYYLRPNGDRLSNLVAYGPTKIIKKELDKFDTRTAELQQLLRILSGYATESNSPCEERGWNKESNQYILEYISHENTELESIGKERKLVGILPHEKKAISASWPESAARDLA